MESKIRILNAGYTNLTAQELLDCLMEDVGKRQKSSVIFLNVDVVMKLEKDKELADITERAASFWRAAKRELPGRQQRS